MSASVKSKWGGGQARTMLVNVTVVAVVTASNGCPKAPACKKTYWVHARQSAPKWDAACEAQRAPSVRTVCWRLTAVHAASDVPCPPQLTRPCGGWRWTRTSR
eukprot:COSAG01_NODE_1416_length_10373_cov_4.944984_8_plen_103_part_00